MKYLICLMTLILSLNLFAFDLDDLFKEGYYHQDEVLTPRANEITVTAKIDGEFKNYVLAKFTKKFMRWNIQRRKEAIDNILSHQSPDLNGPHNGVVATYGYKRPDSLFALNNSVKGMGFIPKRETIKELMQLLRSTDDSSSLEKLALIKELYENVDYWFDLRGQISLELYSEAGFLTQTFINQAYNPLSTIVYLDVPSYKFKAVTQLLDPNDPTLTGYAKDLADYSNLIHSYFHGEFTKQFIAVVYWAVEIYDNTPGKVEARGRRIVPPMP